MYLEVKYVTTESFYEDNAKALYMRLRVVMQCKTFTDTVVISLRVDTMNQ